MVGCFAWGELTWNDPMALREWSTDARNQTRPHPSRGSTSGAYRRCFRRPLGISTRLRLLTSLAPTTSARAGITPTVASWDIPIHPSGRLLMPYNRI